jgi:TonB family protein
MIKSAQRMVATGLLACLAIARADQQPAPVVKPLSTPTPTYPKAEFDAGHQGTVVLGVHVLKDGSVGTTSVYQSSGYPALDQAAQDAAAGWKFSTPTTVAGDPVEADVQLPLSFNISNGTNALQQDAAQEMKRLLKMPCSQINTEVAAFKSTQGDKKLGEMTTFKETTGALFLASYAKPMDARMKLVGRLDRAYPAVVDACTAQPDAIYENVLADALKATPP